jgi:hypothetical protein
VAAEQLREHLAYDSGDVITVAVEVAGAGETGETRRLLKVMHAEAHEFDATLDGRTLLTEARGDGDDTLHAIHQLPFRRQRALG